MYPMCQCACLALSKLCNRWNEMGTVFMHWPRMKFSHLMATPCPCHTINTADYLSSPLAQVYRHSWLSMSNLCEMVAKWTTWAAISANSCICITCFHTWICEDSAASMTGNTTQKHSKMWAPNMSILPIQESPSVQHANECAQICPEDLCPGDCISCNQLESNTPGMIPTWKGMPTTKNYKAATVFVDHASHFISFPLCLKKPSWNLWDIQKKMA